MEQVELKSFDDPNNAMGHSLPGDKVWVSRPRDDDSNPTSQIPVSTVFATGNGGEFRKSFHSYPAPYAQLVESPSTWSIQPMQIDTKNRDGSMAEPGMPFKPGPYPTAAQAPRSGADAVYSGLLECPCTDRISKSLGANGGAPVAQVAGTCAHAIETAKQCEAAAQALAAAIPAPAAKNASTCTYSERSGVFLAEYAAGSPTTGWKTLAQAQAWCCAHKGCAGVTFQDGAYTARARATPTPNPMKGLASWIRGGTTTPFNFSTGSIAEKPPGCSLESAAAGVSAFFNQASATQATCGGKPGTRKVSGGGSAGTVSLSLSMDEAANQVTITMAGPADVWYGVGFNAGSMSDKPWAVIVDGQGKVSERKLADQAPGTLLQPSVKVVSSTVVTGRRTVVLTRTLTMADYEANYFDFSLAKASLPYITAVGSGPAFAYHKSHYISTLALFADAAPTCVCAAAPPPFGQTGSGTVSYDATGTVGSHNSTVGFGKACVPECDPDDAACTKSSSMIAQKNPTCDVRTYVGGLSCCHHLYYLTDKNQSGLISSEELVYQMKARFYFQEYSPTKHKELYRWHWQTAMGAGEYDVPKCAAGTPPEECVHEIHAKIQVKDFASGACNPRSGLNVLTPACKNNSVGFKPIFLGGHCHAPTCLSMELYNNDTGELLCRNVPTYGNLTKNATGARRFEEDGYLALPPCVWGAAEQGLLEPPLLTWDMNLSAIKRCNSTYGHTGEMARWQGHGIIV
jgi:hypothetical protein